MSAADAMLTLCGTVANVFPAPEGIDKKTGETYGGGWRVQVLAQVPLQNAATKLDLVTLSTDLPDAFQALRGKRVRVPVGAFIAGKAVGFYCLKGQPPLPVSEAS